MEVKILQQSKGPGTCRSCGAPIVWAETLNFRRLPFDPPIEVVRVEEQAGRLIDVVDTAISRTHFQTCPHAASWRRPQNNAGRKADA